MQVTDFLDGFAHLLLFASLWPSPMNKVNVPTKI